MMKMMMNWGCGPITPGGWVNTDVIIPDGAEGVEWDIFSEKSLWGVGAFDGIVAHHSLCAISNQKLQALFGGLYELLKPGGILRVSVPAITEAFDAYVRNDAKWFPNFGRESSIDEAFCNYVNWYSTNLSVFTPNRLRDLYLGARFRETNHCKFRETGFGLAEIVELDNRPKESLIVEGLK